MDKQRRQNWIKRNASFFALCVLVVLILVILTVPIKLEVNSVGGKPPFLFALLFSALSLVATIGMAYSTYLAWFQEARARSNVKRTVEQLAKRFPIFRLPMWNPALVFWYLRIISPIASIILLGFFLLALLSAF